MHLAQDTDVVHTFTPDRSDQPFGKAILPRRGWCAGLMLVSDDRMTLDYLVMLVRIEIAK